jgi:hypothetical protein
MQRDELERRLGKPDIQQIRLLLRATPAERLRPMLAMQKIMLLTWRRRLRAAHPELTDLELTKLVFERLKRNG